MPFSSYFPSLLLLATAFASLSYGADQLPLTHISDAATSKPLTLELRHFHAIAPGTHRSVFKDVSSSSLSLLSAQSEYSPQLSLRAKSTLVHRPRSQTDFQAARYLSRHFGQDAKVEWQPEDILGPDVRDVDTLTALAKMTSNAYLEPTDALWYDLGAGWNNSYDIGWEPDADGFRGHVFATPDNSTIVLAIKGTSAGFVGGGGPTSRKDKFNDNLLWSCCCARIDWSWTTVCGCYAGVGKCNQDCLEDALREESLFYPVGTNLYNNLTYMYPNSNIWVTGHSLGGGLAALVGLTFGLPVVAYESPGDRLAAKRLHLPTPPSTQHLYHLYHTADPVAMGSCTGRLSSCYAAGFALETRCHLGRSIVYDTVQDLKWAVDIRTHPIKIVIDQVLPLDWDIPEAKEEEDCVDCYSWEFGDFETGKKAHAKNGTMSRVMKGCS